MKLSKLWPAFAVIAGFVACGGSSDDESPGTTGGATSGGKGGSAGKSATGGSATTGGTSSGGSSGKGGSATGGSATGGSATAGTGNEAGTTSTAGTTGAAGQGGTTQGAGGAGGEPASGGAGGGPGCVNLTVKNVSFWCDVSIDGGGYSTSDSQTVCVSPGAITLKAKAASGTFEISANMWHHTDGDSGSGETGDQVSESGVSIVTETVSGTDCIWVCCPFSATHMGCAVGEQCL